LAKRVVLTDEIHGHALELAEKLHS
jgi:hypothetical protein